jgi:F0F1-type ATP synthase membrane subunit b/b'
VTNANKGRTPGSATEGPSTDPVFDALERRIESLANRMRELTSENGKLKAAAAAAAAERDKLKAELASIREQASRSGDEAAQIVKYEAEREAVRARIERLLKSLEGVETPLPS